MGAYDEFEELHQAYSQPNGNSERRKRENETPELLTCIAGQNSVSITKSDCFRAYAKNHSIIQPTKFLAATMLNVHINLSDGSTVEQILV